VGSRTIFANNATLAGHVEVHDDASISAFSAIHQFCRVGRHAYIGGFSVITLDALPFSRTVGQKPLWYGVNRIGLERKGMSASAIREIERAFRVLLRSGKNTSQALEELRALPQRSPDVEYLIQFVAASKRGVIKSKRGGARGAGAD
jgi:UDP-N-acetylglucosamine acyltransferase